MQFNFSHLYQEHELSDLDVLLVGPEQQQQDNSSSGQEHGICRLASFPGHTAILSNSPFFKAQMLRWQHKRPHQETPDSPTQAGQASAAPQQKQQAQELRMVARGSTDSDASSPAKNSSYRRLQLVLTLESADHLPAELAVLQALYGVKELPQLLSELPQEQQLQVALLADMWQVPQLTSTAVHALRCHLKTHGGLSQEATQQLLSLQAVPDFLQTLLEHLLACRFGAHEAVWADPGLAGALLQVSIPVMQVFLSLGQLQVASEDTVLFTATRYLDQFSDPADRKHVTQHLAPLIRCQHLSMHCLTTVVASQDSGVLAPLRSVLPALLMMASGNRGSISQHYKLLAQYRDVPASWIKPPRCMAKKFVSVAGSVQVHMTDLKQAVQDCVADKQTRYVNNCACYHCTTPVLGGCAFYPYLSCRWAEEAGGCVINLHTGFKGWSGDVLCSYACDIRVSAGAAAGAGVTYEQQARTHLPVPINNGTSWSNFFSLPPMKTGWEDAAWARTNFPTSGQFTIDLHVYDVLHAEARSSAPRQPNPPPPRIATPRAN